MEGENSHPKHPESRIPKERPGKGEPYEPWKDEWTAGLHFGEGVYEPGREDDAKEIEKIFADPERKKQYRVMRRGMSRGMDAETYSIHAGAVVEVDVKGIPANKKLREWYENGKVTADDFEILL